LQTGKRWGKFPSSLSSDTIAGNYSAKGWMRVEKLLRLTEPWIFTPQGEMVAYGSRILKSETLRGFGTKHAAAKV